MYQIYFYVPESHLETVKTALFAKGAGLYKAYDHCCWQVRGEGQFRPMDNSQPFLGQINQLEKVVEYKVEMVCTEAAIKGVLQALITSHPYEEPAYGVCKILTLADFQ